MSRDSVRFEDVLTQLEEKRQALEKREQEADRLYRQREEDARKAREFREQMQRAKENARSRGRGRSQAHPAGRPLRFDAVFAELEKMRKEQAKAERTLNANEARAELRRQLNEAESAIDKRDARSEPIPKPSRPIRKGGSGGDPRRQHPGRGGKRGQRRHFAAESRYPEDEGQVRRGAAH